MEKLLNPRGYLSWTQIDMWRRSKDRYIRQYINGEGLYLDNSGIRFGKKTSEALEKGEYTDDETLNGLMALLPHYAIREHEIKMPLQTPHGEVMLLGKLDTFGRDPICFREYKTGRTKWTQAKAESHKQLHHYATLIWLAHKKLPSEIWLDWAETEKAGDEAVLTGSIQSFQVKLAMVDILEYIALVSKVAVEIDEAYRKKLKELS